MNQPATFYLENLIGCLTPFASGDVWVMPVILASGQTVKLQYADQAAADADFVVLDGLFVAAVAAAFQYAGLP